MRLFIAFPVLVMVLAMVLEGPAPAQASSDISSTFESIPNKLKDFENTLDDMARAAIDHINHIKPKEILTKTRNWLSETFGKVKEKIKTTFS